jgi:hypothetical protein
MVQYHPGGNNPSSIGLVVDVEYRVKSNDFLIFIMWSDANKPQALFQEDCFKRGLRVLS